MLSVEVLYGYRASHAKIYAVDGTHWAELYKYYKWGIHFTKQAPYILWFTDF